MSHLQFDSSKSKSFQQYQQFVVIPYFGIGNVEGYVSSDNCQLGSDQDTIINLLNVSFVKTVNESDFFEFQSAKYDGFVGLGFPEVSVGKVPPLFQEMVKQKKIPDASFSLYLNSIPESRDSAIVFGGVDTKFGEIKNYHKVSSQGFWSLNLDYMEVNEYRTSGNYQVLIGSADMVLIGDHSLLDGILKEIGQVDINCQNYEKLPEVIFVFDGVKYSISKEQYILQFQAQGKQQCICQIYAIDMPQGFKQYLTVGTPLLRAYYTHFVFGNGKVGSDNPPKIGFSSKH